jgi:hypothetical protein
MIKSETLHVNSVLIDNARPYWICLAGPHRVREGYLHSYASKPGVAAYA